LGVAVKCQPPIGDGRRQKDILLEVVALIIIIIIIIIVVRETQIKDMAPCCSCVFSKGAYLYFQARLERKAFHHTFIR